MFVVVDVGLEAVVFVVVDVGLGVVVFSFFREEFAQNMEISAVVL